MRILSHYFVARFLGLFTTVLVAAFLLLATIELVLNFDDISSFADASRAASQSAPSPDPAHSARLDADSIASAGSAQSELLGAFRYLWVRLTSYYLADLLPIASFAATFFALGWAGRAMELVAIQASGIRLARVVLPILATALILSFAAAILHETVILRAQQVWNAEGRSDDGEVDFGRQGFWHHQGRTLTHIQKADRESRTLQGVEIFERGESGRITRVIRSPRVVIDPQGVWRIESARIWRFDEHDLEAGPDLEEVAAMALDLESLRGAALLEADAGVLPIRALATYLSSAPPETPSGLQRLRIRFHQRLSSPLLVFLFAWLALPFALRIDPRGHFVRPAVEGVTVIGLFFFVRSAGTILSREGLFPAQATPWLALGLFLVGGAIALRKTPI